MSNELSCDNKVVGLKQSTKAIIDGIAKSAYIADGIDAEIKNEFVKLCKAHNVPVSFVTSKTELGDACDIEVAASVAVIINETT